MPITYIFILIVIFLIIIILCFIEPMMIRQKLNNNNEHGSARWSTVHEIKKNFHVEKVNSIKKSGFPIYYSKNNKKVWFDTETPHWIYLGSTGSGKSVTAVIPSCAFIATAKIKKSVFITDPKGEIFETTSKLFRDNGYDVLTLDFRHPEYSKHINLLEPIIKEYELYDKYKKLSNEETDERKKIDYNNKSIIHFSEADKLVEDISKTIMNDPTAREKFWNSSASDFLYGLIFLFLEDYIDGKIKRNQITLTSIKKFQSSSMIDKNNKILKKYIENKSYAMKSKDKLQSILNISDTTYRSIISTFSERMSLYDNINVENITSNSDFEFDCFGKKPTVLYCCIPDESKIYYSLISIIVSLIYKTLVLLCNEQENKRLPYDLVFLLDEFANTPPLPDISTMVSVARSRGMSFHFFIQSFSQLDNIYGKEDSDTIKDNCGLAYLKTNTQETAEMISQRLGTHSVETHSINYSMSLLNTNGSESTSLISRNLMTADEIRRLKYKTIIFSSVTRPILRKTVPYKKFKCYKFGTIKREIRPLQRLVETYYTVENLKYNDNNNSQEPKFDTNEAQIKTKLVFIINKVIKIFGKIDFNVEYVKENNNIIAKIFLAPPLSLNDIKGLEELSSKLDFHYNAIADKEKINRKNRNSLIEIFLINHEKEGVRNE